MFKCVQISVFVVSGLHIFLGLLSIGIGAISNFNVDVWLAHTVSPIWSGGFFCVAGSLGLCCTRRKSLYVIMCFTAFSLVSIVVAVISMQLLRAGLVNHTADGHTFQKEETDHLIYISLAAASAEILVCLASIVLSCSVARTTKEELINQKDGMFYVKVLGQKEIVVVTKPVDDKDELTAV